MMHFKIKLFSLKLLRIHILAIFYFPCSDQINVSTSEMFLNILKYEIIFIEMMNGIFQCIIQLNHIEPTAR